MKILCVKFNVLNLIIYQNAQENLILLFKNMLIGEIYNLMSQQKKKSVNKQLSKRQNIRLKLKGSLSAWKLNLGELSSREVQIIDRSPEPSEIANSFYEMYEKKRKIGEGASGIVYQCVSKKDGKVYAVKVARGDVELLRINKRAFKIMKGLNHPYIIKAHSLFLNQVNQKMHFIMQYCPLPSLSSIENILSRQQKKQIVKQIVETLTYLHNQGVCHRDIKLQNILYDQQKNQIKIIDFGICKQIFDKNHHHVKMWTTTGTLHYMAPQMLSGAAYDEKVDMWALGVLTYRLFYGKYPFESEYKSQVIEQISSAQPQYDDEDPILNDFIKHLICKDPKNRMSAFLSLKHPWIEKNVSEKARLGSLDDMDFLFDIRMRNYSVGYLDSPQQKVSKEQKISELKEVSIFQMKRSYISPASSSN